jgi:hypothetical protein
MELVDRVAADAGCTTREFHLQSGRAAPSVWLVSLFDSGSSWFPVLSMSCLLPVQQRWLREG